MEASSVPASAARPTGFTSNKGRRALACDISCSRRSQRRSGLALRQHPSSDLRPHSDRQRLRDGREGWRRKQVRAVVRDAPEEAVAALESLGYSVSLQEGVERPEGNVRLLSDF